MSEIVAFPCLFFWLFAVVWDLLHCGVWGWSVVCDCDISLSFSLGCLLLCGNLLLCGVWGWSVVCDCGISWSFSFDCLLLCGNLLPCGVWGWSVVCDCGISWSYLFFGQVYTLLKWPVVTLLLIGLKASTVKPVLSCHSKRTQKIGFQYQLSFNVSQKYCRMLRGEHSAFNRVPTNHRKKNSLTFH